MTGTGVAALDRSVEKTNRWLDELKAITQLDSRERAYDLLRATLHALRDRVPPNEAIDLAAQLPMLVRGFYFEGWRPADKPLAYRDKAEFVGRVCRQAPWLEDSDAEGAITAVFEVLASHVAPGETAQLRHVLPPAVRELWAQPAL